MTLGSWIRPGVESDSGTEGREVASEMEREDRLSPKDGCGLVGTEIFCKAIILSPSGR